MMTVPSSHGVIYAIEIRLMSNGITFSITVKFPR